MTRTSRKEQAELRAKVHEAIAAGNLSPNDVMDYIANNGWKYNPPSKPTIIAILKENGIEYRHGAWERK